MKASLRLRDDQKPLVRAKVPISIFGLPFLSGVCTGETSDLRFDLATAFDSGPAVRVSYRPNDSINPFSLVVKTGVGALGSPVSAPMSITTEFNLLGKGNPSFFLHFKPRIGDFSLLKTTASRPAVDHGSNGGFLPENGVYSGVKENGFLPETVHSIRGIDGLLSGVEIMARSVLPIHNRAAVKFRWGVRLPVELRNGFVGEELGVQRKHSAAWMPSDQQLPLLAMRKISIERMVPKPKKKEDNGENQLEALRAEHGSLRNAVEELQRELVSWKGTLFSGKSGGSVSPFECKGRGGEIATRNNGGKGVAPVNWKNGKHGGAVAKEDVNDELKKALMSATASSV